MHIRSYYEVLIEKGTILYRASPVIETQPSPTLCADTNKLGKYFATGPRIAEGMCHEYKKAMNICRYEVLDTIVCYRGKSLFSDYNVNHYDDELYPITKHDISYYANEAEVFLSRWYDLLCKLRFVGSYQYIPYECYVSSFFIHNFTLNLKNGLYKKQKPKKQKKQNFISNAQDNSFSRLTFS